MLTVMKDMLVSNSLLKCAIEPQFVFFLSVHTVISRNISSVLAIMKDYLVSSYLLRVAKGRHSAPVSRERP